MNSWPSRRLSSYADTFQICRDCKIVDHSLNRVIVGSPCPTCNSSSQGGLSYFDMSVLFLIDLIDEANKAVQSDEKQKANVAFRLDSAAHIASVVIFTQTLQELLIENFLRRLMIAQELSEEVQSKLLFDNFMYRKRLEQLFPVIVGRTWDKAIAEISQNTNFDYVPLSLFLKNLTEVRNGFLHRAEIFLLTTDLAKECVKRIAEMLDLFKCFHNSFIHPLCFTRRAGNS